MAMSHCGTPTCACAALSNYTRQKHGSFTYPAVQQCNMHLQLCRKRGSAFTYAIWMWHELGNYWLMQGEALLNKIDLFNTPDYPD
jgi:hypothetical protein